MNNITNSDLEKWAQKSVNIKNIVGLRREKLVFGVREQWHRPACAFLQSSAFVTRLLESTIPKFAASQISML